MLTKTMTFQTARRFHFISPKFGKNSMKSGLRTTHTYDHWMCRCTCIAPSITHPWLISKRENRWFDVSKKNQIQSLVFIIQRCVSQMRWRRAHCNFVNEWVHTFKMDNRNATKVISKKKFFLERIGCFKNKTIPLPIGVYNVGRSKSAHVIIPSKYCNRKHCRLVVDCESCHVCVDVSRYHLQFYNLRTFRHRQYNFGPLCRVRKVLAVSMWTRSGIGAAKYCYKRMI